MSIEKWQEITNGIDEKYADECAEYLAQHAAKTTEPIDGGTPTEFRPKAAEKSRKRGWMIGAAAAAVVICAAAGMILSRGDALLPNDTPTEEITSETSETGETAETEQIAEDVVIPEFEADETMWELSSLNAYNLQGLDDYGLPDDLDVTTLPDFAYVEEHLATLTEQEQAELAADNYTWNSYGWRYAGNGAWIIKYQYHLAVGGKTGSYFTQYLLVRDNTVEACIKEVYGNSYYDDEYGSNDGYYGNSLGDWGECLLYCHENGILAINTETFEAKDIITADSYCVIHFITDNYIVYSEADGFMRVYRADIDGYYDTDCRFVSECSERYGAEVICRRDEQYYSFELATNTLTALDMTTEQYNELTLRYDVQSEAYAANYINDEKRDDMADYAYNTTDNGKFELVYKKTGERLTVRLDGIRELLGSPDTMTHELLGFSGDVLYLTINENNEGLPCCIAAIDVNTFNTAVMPFDGGYFSAFNSTTGGVYHRLDSVVTALTLTADLGAVEDAWVEDTDDYILAPELIEDDSVWSTTTFSLDAIEEQVGYDTPVDVTALPEYAEAVAHAETLEQSVRDELKAQNYSALSTNHCYVGSDNADWLCTASYTLVTGGITYPYYTRLFVVKDNKVGETLLEVSGDIYSIIQRTDDVAIAADNGIYLYKRSDSAVTKLTDISGGYSRLGQLNEKYILFYDGDRVLKVYVCDSGEVISTDIYMGIYDGTNYMLDGDRIVYCDSMHSGPFKSFDIPSQQYDDTEINAVMYEELGNKKLEIQNEHYAAESANDFDIIVHYLGDGSEQCYTFRELAADVRYDTRAMKISPIGFDGNILMISAQALDDRLESCVIALDVETGAAYRHVTDSVVQRFVFNSFIGYSYSNNIEYAIQFLGAPERGYAEVDIQSNDELWRTADTSLSFTDDLSAGAEGSLRYMYIGSSKADWLVSASYSSGSARVFYVKDSAMAGDVLQLDCEVNDLHEWRGDILISSGDGIYLLKKGSDSAERIVEITGDYSRVARLTDDYIFYSDGYRRYKVYYADSGEVYTPDITLGSHDGPIYGFSGDKIIFYTGEDGAAYRSFDFITREYADLDIDIPQFDELCKPDSNISSDRFAAALKGDRIVELYDTESGDSVLLSFRQLSEYGLGDAYLRLLGFDGEILYIFAESDTGASGVIALDIATCCAEIFDVGAPVAFNGGAVQALDGNTLTAIKYAGDPDDTVLTIWADSNKLERYLDYIPGFVRADGADGDICGYLDMTPVVFKEVPAPNADGDYATSLQYRLQQEQLGAIPAEECVDIFLTTEYCAYELINSSYTMPLSLIGLNDHSTAQMYPYTKQLGSDERGFLKAVSINAAPGAFAYRRSMAREVFGTDDPAVVAQYLSDWDSFDNTAALMKQHGYYMLSGYDAAYRTASYGEWTDGSGSAVIPAAVQDWMQRTAEYVRNGYCKSNTIWSDEWAQDFAADGDVFGLFFPTWGIEYTLAGNAGDDGYGDWAVCAGPESFFYSENMMCVSANTDNKELASDVLYYLTCDYDVMRDIAENEAEYFVNNAEVMQDISAAGYSSGFLAGQNPVTVFAANAQSLDISVPSQYATSLSDALLDLAEEFFSGLCTMEDIQAKLQQKATALSENG